MRKNNISELKVQFLECIIIYIFRENIYFFAFNLRKLNNLKLFQAEIAFHMWTEDREIIETAKVLTTLESISARQFLQDHYLSLVFEEEEEKSNLTDLYIIIGVLGLLLVLVIFSSAITIVMLKRRMDRKWRAEIVSRQVIEGIF